MKIGLIPVYNGNSVKMGVFLGWDYQKNSKKNPSREILTRTGGRHLKQLNHAESSKCRCPLKIKD
jgi:hypothetical protein